MNPGYVSYVLWTVGVILSWSGWHLALAGDQPVKRMWWFFGLWLLSANVFWSLPSGWGGSFALVPLLILLWIEFREMRNRSELASVCSFGLLVGAVFALVQLLDRIDPMVIVLHDRLDPVLAAAALAVCYGRNARVQLTLLTVALIVGDTYLAWLFRAHEPAIVGGRSFQDMWWTTVAAARLMSAVVQFATSAYTRLHRLLRIRRTRR